MCSDKQNGKKLFYASKEVCLYSRLNKMTAEYLFTFLSLHIYQN
jgi:hypothetical protein